MKFDWDDTKAASNHAKHRVEFRFSTRVFLDPDIVITEDSRRDYKEPRYNAMGMIDLRLYVVSYTIRGGVYRLISARKGNSREQKKYHQLHTGSEKSS